MHGESGSMTNGRDILIVEDSSMQAKRLRRLLEEHGYQVSVAFNGKEGLDMLRERRPSLVVSDVIMPVMDGYEMCRTIKNDPAFRQLPVILLTSLSNPQDVFLGLESGADSYISKPYESKNLLDRIESVLATASVPADGSQKEAIQVFLGGKHYLITSTSRQILNLLLSTYQDAVEQNRILREMRTKLVMMNEQLEKLVAERTEELRNEIHERKCIEVALASEKERLAVTLRSIADGVIATDTDGNVILMNSAAEQLTDWPQQEAMDKPVSTVLSLTTTKTSDSGSTVEENVLEIGKILGVDDQITLHARGGAERIVAVTGAPILDQGNIIMGMVFVVRDITESKRLEEELVKAQKLESLGVLAGGIAHDFNNLLTAILGNITLARIHAKPGDKAAGRLIEAEKASQRAQELTKQLLTFSKGGAPVKKTTSLGAILRDSTWFAIRGSNVGCDLSIAAELWPVEIDEGQISQVIHNLIINASQAMPDGGIIRVRAENLNGDLDSERGLPIKTGEKYVRISVADEGHGIRAEHLPKLFDPYFTTKPKGTGLGLATCYSILKNHDGIITVESRVGEGATFHVYLPAAAGQVLARTDIREFSGQDSGTVLVMDDEEMLRDFIAELLTLLGYEVHCAADGLQTIEAYCRAKESGRPFDCVLMDLTIPGGMGGKEAIRRLREIDPNIKAIVSSGYSDDPVMADYRKYGFSGVVAKPYNAEELNEVLQRVIAGES